ncbi:hypothetical protein [Nocardia nova]|uniref:hypothetical protein n=1 Tax=Nocardia nova TaxID=37330 RepID=UPI003F6DB565
MTADVGNALDGHERPVFDPVSRTAARLVQCRHRQQQRLTTHAVHGDGPAVTVRLANAADQGFERGKPGIGDHDLVRPESDPRIRLRRRGIQWCTEQIQALRKLTGRDRVHERFLGAGRQVRGGVGDDLHLHATAADAASVRCGPPAVRDRRALAAALATATGDEHGWVRGVGYFDSVAGDVDATALTGPRRRSTRCC